VQVEEPFGILALEVSCQHKEGLSAGVSKGVWSLGMGCSCLCMAAARLLVCAAGYNYAAMYEQDIQ
jgi:hypothetical protein